MEELADTSRRAPRFSFVPERQSGRDVLTAEAICKAYGENQVLRDVSLVVRRGERVGVIGPNGLGKSTLLRILVERLESDDGEVRWRHEVRIGYFAQDHREVLANPEPTALDTLWAVRPREGNAFVRGHLGRVLFSGDDVQKRVGMLSGGEAARLVFGCLAADQPNKEKREKQKETQATAGATSGPSWEEQKRKRNRQKELPARRDKVMEAIEAAEARKVTIHNLYASDGFFERTPQAEVDALVAEEAALGPKIEALMREWEELETEIAGAES